MRVFKCEKCNYEFVEDDIDNHNLNEGCPKCKAKEFSFNNKKGKKLND